ncbi:nucleoid-associated protein [Bradyrhizobium japonicum]|uniref:nucleoid-associated protein n=1 Tax=Bradyrhizobium japonicum TaxID=375 RepID=UPI00339A03C4
MLLENLKLNRISVHEVFRRGADKRRLDPLCADLLEQLPEKAIDQFKLRITEALSAEAKSLQMQIAKHEAGSHLHNVCELLGATDGEFLELSRRIPNRLADEQRHPNIPGGVVLVFDGTVGGADHKFVGVIKAEKQTGFRRYKSREKTLTEFLDDLFLTAAQRLYKVALFVRVDESLTSPDGWNAYVFDTNISPTHRETAAQYFYEGFLGCELPQDGAYETARFFDLTRDYVKQSGLPTEKRRDIVDALHTYVKAENAKTFSSNEFAEKYLPVEHRDAFSNFLSAKKFPMRAVVRDTSAMGNRLRRRRFRFGSDIELSVSAVALNDKTVEIKEGTAKEFGGEGLDRWTRITIRQSLTDER